MAINYTKRLVVWELLTGHRPSYIALEHELYRLAHVYRDGLTEKEYKFLMQRCEVLKEENAKMVRLKDRLKGTLSARH